MIRKLHLRNFKAWRQLDIEFGQVTALFGTNSSGKSSLLQFLLMLKQTKNATDRKLVLDFGGSDKLVNLGNFRDTVHLRDDSQTISWNLAWRLPKQLRISNPIGRRTDVLFKGRRLSTACTVGMRGSSPWAYALEYALGDSRFTLQPSSENSTEFTLESSDDSFGFLRNPGRPWALPGPVKTHLFPDQARTFYQNSDFLGHFEFEYESLMDRVFYLGPLREYPRREYIWSGASPDDVGPRGERTIDAVLAATAHNEMRQLARRRHFKTFQEFVAHWLREIGLVNSFRIQEIAPGSNLYRAMVKSNRYSSHAALTDVGFGVSQILPALVLLFYVPEGSTILMEQPEIHLHPSVQSGLADAIINAAHTRDVQIILESHSEHLMRRLQRRVAEDSECKMPKIKLYFASMIGQTANLSDLKLSEFGEIENWPENFFGDELGEISRIRLATLERKLRSRD